MSKLRHVVFAVVLVTASLSSAEDAKGAAPTRVAPTAEQIKAVLDFEENGKDLGPVLLEVLPCTKVDQTKGSPTQFQCVEPITGPVKKGTTVLAWLAFFGPKEGKYEDLTIEYSLEGKPTATQPVSVTTSGRSRTWKGSTLSKPGAWTIKVLRGTAQLGSVAVTVEK